MNRNDSSFATNPTFLDISRSKFKRDCSVKFTGNVGDLIPFFVDEVLPGDTFNIKTAKVFRLQTPITPIMDNMYLDTYYFYVPNRILWEHWRECMGANYTDAWTPEVEYSVPQVTAPSGGWNIGTIADYFGIPTGVSGISVSDLPFRAYCMIYNEWFRDETLADPVYCPLTDSTIAGSNGSTINDPVKGGIPLKVFKYHDYFTSCLPSPQRGPDVSVPISFSDNLPVMPLDTAFAPSLVRRVDTDYGVNSSGIQFKNGIPSTGETWPDWPIGNHPVSLQRRSSPLTHTAHLYTQSGTTETSSTPLTMFPNNLYAVPKIGTEVYATVNAMRLAFGIQRLFEKDARSGGGRYTEIIKAHFGVTSPDARQQRPEYLGGNRLPVNINQVVQQTFVADDSPIGMTGAVSLTSDVHGDFSKSFTEHGLIIGLCCVRYNHTYQQGIERLWSRKTRFDFYWPGLANIGEQAVLNKEIYASGTSTDAQVFGYQEAWAEYRYKPSRVSGEMRSSSPISLDVWHLGDDYSSMPTLSSSWKQEDKTNVDRVLSVTSAISNQFFADFYIMNETVRPMPLYSIPGLIDHH